MQSQSFPGNFPAVHCVLVQWLARARALCAWPVIVQLAPAWIAPTASMCNAVATAAASLWRQSSSQWFVMATMTAGSSIQCAMIVIMRCVFISRSGQGACLFTTKKKTNSSKWWLGEWACTPSKQGGLLCGIYTYIHTYTKEMYMSPIAFTFHKEIYSWYDLPCRKTKPQGGYNMPAELGEPNSERGLSEATACTQTFQVWVCKTCSLHTAGVHTYYIFT